MSILHPDHNMVAIVTDIINSVNIDYSAFLAMNNDIDDIQMLAEMLNERTKEEGLHIQIEWFVDDAKRSNPAEWISAMAGVAGKTCFLDVILWESNLQGAWGPSTFIEMVLKMLEHETIHFNQYDKIGLDRLNLIHSGHQKGTVLKEKTGNDRDWMRCYLRDPHELMAYGHDLSEEIKLSSNPELALRNPEAFIEELPVYGQYRNIFPSNAKPLQKLLSYAAGYSQAIG
jgi:hypothetical protein